MTENKSKKVVLLSVLFLLAAVAVILGVSYFFSAYFSSRSNTAEAVNSCPAGHRTVHTVLIINDKAVPAQSEAKRCDILTITNHDPKKHEMAFGEHESHRAIDGVSEKLLGTDESLSVQLHDTGTFYFHDHIDDLSQGFIYVTE